MKLATPAVIIVVAVALCVPAFAAAQEVVKSFSQLNTRVSVGDTVWVTDAQGREIKGLRVIGYQNSDRFLKTLSLATAP